MKKTWLIAACVSVVAALVLAACGGDDDDGGSSADEDGITKALEAAATSGDPSICTQYQTLSFTEQTSEGTGQAAIKSCQEDAANNVAEQVDVSDIEVDGNTATAKAAVTGSTFDGQTLELALVKEGDVWKLDRFAGFEDFDKTKIVAAFKEEFAKDPSVPPAAADCVAQQMENAPDETIEQLFTAQDTSQIEQQLFGPCEEQFQGQ